MSISYTCILALSIGMFHCLELVCLPIDADLLLVCNYKAILFFFKLFKYLKKSKKMKKPKIRTRKDVIFGNCRVMSPLNRALYVTSVGWVYSLTLGAILIYLSLSTPTGQASSPYGTSIDASCVVEMSQFCITFRHHLPL